MSGKRTWKNKKIGLLVLVSLFICTLFLLQATISTVANGVNYAPASGKGSSIVHVILVMEENHAYSQVIGCSCAPYINSLANQYALATNYYPLSTYSSLTDYLQITGGSDFGITTDCTPPGSTQTPNCPVISSTNLFSLLSSKGYTWKTYAESMPSNCYQENAGSSGSGNLYLVHHTVPPYYSDLSSVCSKYDVPLGSVSSQSGNFFNDLKSNNLPSFSFVSPNACDDMHTACSSANQITVGDTWLKQFMAPILSSPEFSSTVILITWDDGDVNSAGQINNVPMIVVGPPSLVHYGQYNTHYTHYSALATIEDVFGLGNLGRGDASATPLTAMLNSNGGNTTTTATSTTTSNSTSSTSDSSSTTSSISTSDTTTTSTSNTTSATASLTNSSSTSSSTTNESSSTTTSSIANSTTSLTTISASSQVSFSSSNPATTVSASSSQSSSASSTNSVSGVNPVVGMLSSLAPTRNPRLAIGVGIYEAPLIGALGYILLNVRRGPKYWTLGAQHPSKGRRDLFWRNRGGQRIRRPTGFSGNSFKGVSKSARRLFWKTNKK